MLESAGRHAFPRSVCVCVCVCVMCVCVCVFVYLCVQGVGHLTTFQWSWTTILPCELWNSTDIFHSAPPPCERGAYDLPWFRVCVMHVEGSAGKGELTNRNHKGEKENGSM